MDEHQQSLFPYPMPEAPRPQQPRRRRRLIAGLAATALVAGAGGVAAGYALGDHSGAPGTADASSGTQSTDTSGGGIQTIPGNGWRFSDGQSDGSGGETRGQGSNPFSDPYGGSSGSQSTDSTTKASVSQLTGLVRIVSTMKYDQAKAAGTGMVLTSTGEMVTNHHVVEGATSIKVTVMTTGKTYVAKVVGTDAKDDVAVLQLTGASGLSTVTPDTDGAAVGDAVTAVGDANGTVSYLSAASGRITALKQSITTQGDGTASGERLTGLMQISSEVISGDSGGATYDKDGQVVAMTTAASSGGSDVTGYAVPIDKVLSIAGDLENGVTGARYAYGNPAFLGVALGQTGTTVRGVYQGTAAATAGIAAGDRITAVDGTKVTTATTLHNAIAKLAPGDSVSITWTATDSTTHTKTLTLGTGPIA
ncbi:MAG: S1C family serine protease [Nocardioidaceae bacterium]